MPESIKSNLIKEVKQKVFLDTLFKEQTIDLNNYFAYSGKEEKTNYKISYLIEKEKRHRAKFARGIKNDMSKYKFKIK